MNGEELEEGETEGRVWGQGRDFHLRVKLMLYFSLSSQFLKHSLYSNVFYSILLRKKLKLLFKIAFPKSLFNLHHYVYVRVCLSVFVYLLITPFVSLK